MLTPLSIWDPLVPIGSTIMQPLYWVVSGILVLFHSVWSPLFGPDNGWTWALSIVSLTVVIRLALIPLFVKQIKSSRSMQLLQPKVRELQKKYGHDREKLGQETMKLYGRTTPTRWPPACRCCCRCRSSWPCSGCSTAPPRHSPRPLAGDPPRAADFAEPGRRSSARGSPTPSSRSVSPTAITSVHVVTLVLIIAMTVTLFITQLQLMRKNMPPEASTGPFAQQQKIMLYVFPLIFADRWHQLPGRRADLLVHLEPVDDGPAVLRDPPQPSAGNARVRSLGSAAQVQGQGRCVPRCRG